MDGIMTNTASVMWIILAVLVFVRLRQWDKKFSDLYDELKGGLENDNNAK